MGFKRMTPFCKKERTEDHRQVGRRAPGMSRKRRRRQPGRFALNAYNSGLAALTVGSIFKGVLDIYGTTNRLVYVYAAVGGLLTAVGLIAYLLGRRPAPLPEAAEA